MKKFLALAAAASVLAIAAPASAQAWQSINQRQANLDQRIDMGVRNGSLTRNEAVQLRSEFNPIKHIVIPLIGALVFIGPLISTIYPVPPYPLRLIRAGP